MTVKIFAGKLFDPIERKLIPNQLITVNKAKGTISEVRTFDDNDVQTHIGVWALDSDVRSIDFDRPSMDGVDVVDLRKLTVLPGFIDTHVHMFLHSYDEASWSEQLTQESLAERTIRATVHAKKTLLAGFTSVRDLGTEGAGDADIALRKTLSGPNPLIPGPRYFCASRAIISSGSYGPLSALYPLQQGVDGVTGAVFADGVEECLKAVRVQAGTGADWIKIYADYRSRSRMSPVAPRTAAKSYPNFSKKEMDAMVREAHARGLKVAVHVSNFQNIPYGIDSIEHGTNFLEDINNPEPSRKLLKSLSRNRSCPWTPTLSVIWGEHQRNPSDQWDRVAKAFQIALEVGMDNITIGGDTGPSPHGENSLEMILMRRLGADWSQILRWATYIGWKCLRDQYWENISEYTDDDTTNFRDYIQDRVAQEDREREERLGDHEVPFGVLKPGFAADIIALDGELDGDVDAFEKAVKSVEFVMKGGRIWKEDGLSVDSL